MRAGKTHIENMELMVCCGYIDKVPNTKPCRDRHRPLCLHLSFVLETLVLFVCLIFELEFVYNFSEWWGKVFNPSFRVFF